ncbi:hypothetical protein POREN0001_0905 [Porphyromonas endodontalis ATCC 35406]|uniref:Uncharacterized protein n=1 Tax=Porphyromonas endodontalis (strain ATCC 35406 / DSM 24491 / JCM 8526 / CCUG 16442 / BCRC 14492 / NCTC 13058 / HG 370) TaxID=553175 RepID=C3J9Y3_POREA|nr:hypothetical protein POREN0001_0905 [Porphyromonas endodontalis ATCC 35406]
MQCASATLKEKRRGMLSGDEAPLFECSTMEFVGRLVGIPLRREIE